MLINKYTMLNNKYNENAPAKYPLLLFSGGMDSTYMLDLALVKSHVYTMYVDGGQGPDKVTQEKKARVDIFNSLLKCDNKVLGDFTLNDFSKLQMTDAAKFTKFKQPIPWLLAALYKTDPIYISEVQIGYTLDDAMFVLSEIKDLWNAAWKITHTEDLVPLKFPLIDLMYEKREVIRFSNQELISKTWVCELPASKGKIYKPCGKCPACARLIGVIAECKALYGTDYSTILNKQIQP